MHGATALERVARANDEREIVGTELGVVFWRVGVGVAGAGQNRGALDTCLESLLAKGEALELAETEFLCDALFLILVGWGKWPR